MGWIRKIFRDNTSEKVDDVERLVRRLLFYRDEAVFLDALREAVAFASKGDDFGIRALSEAIRRKSGNPQAQFYAPQMGSLTVRYGDDLMAAEDRLLELAESGELLRDPAATQNLIGMALSVSQDGLIGLLHTIYALAGTEAGYDFQLLFNHAKQIVMLQHSRGQRTWTQEFEDEIGA